MIRHLPTASSYKQLIMGRRDEDIAPLTLERLVQIEKNKQQLSSYEPFERVFTSTLLRTRQTAYVYGYPNHYPHALLDELDFGVYEGRHRFELMQARSGSWKTAPHTIPLGEPLEIFQERVLAFMNQIRDAGIVLMFTHGAWMRALISWLQHRSIITMNQLEVTHNELIVVELQQNTEHLIVIDRGHILCQ